MSTNTLALPAWMTEQQAADYTGLSTRTLRKRIADGSLPACRMRNGRGVRIKTDDVLALFVPIPTLGGDA